MNIPENILNTLTDEQKKKVEAAKSPEELLALAKETGYELTPDQLDAVAGGAVTDCLDTFSPGEWCTITDSCAYLIRYYDDPAIPQDNTYSCTDNALVIKTRDVWPGESNTWEEWGTDCPGGWFEACGSNSSKGSSW